MNDIKACAGCRDDFYNDHNPLGVKRCWLVDGAKIVLRRRVGMDERPPWKREPEPLPNCYNQSGFIFVEPTRER